LLLRRVFQLYRSGRLAPAGGSLDGNPVSLLELLHCEAMVVRIESAVKGENREKTIEAVCREETDLK